MLDSTSYLASFGWKGKGNGLRQDSASRPLAIPQKRTLAGLGKDRDEAFPFWDHLFTAAAKSIQIKISGDTDEPGGNDDVAHSHALHRTTTGILSNRRPVTGTPATSGTTTPSDVDPTYAMPRLSLMAVAKRDGARKRLYARFFKGPVLGPDVEPDKIAVETTETIAQSAAERRAMKIAKPEDETPEQREKAADEGSKKKKRRRDDTESAVTEERKEKKKRRNDLNVKTDGEEGRKGGETRGTKEKQQENSSRDGQPSKGSAETVEEKRQRKADKVERRKRKEERRKAKDEKREARAQRKAPLRTTSLIE